MSNAQDEVYATRCLDFLYDYYDSSIVSGPEVPTASMSCRGSFGLPKTQRLRFDVEAVDSADGEETQRRSIIVPDLVA